MQPMTTIAIPALFIEAPRLPRPFPSGKKATQDYPLTHGLLLPGAINSLHCQHITLPLPPPVKGGEPKAKLLYSLPSREGKPKAKLLYPLPPPVKGGGNQRPNSFTPSPSM